MSLPPGFSKSRWYEWYSKRTGWELLEQFRPLPDEQLHAQCRWPAAVYAVFAVMNGFAFFGRIISDDTFLTTALAFLCLTPSIMLFNDFVDRKRDYEKGKNLAHDYPIGFAGFMVQPAFYTVVCLLVLVQTDWLLTLYIGSVWILGLLYSFARRLLVIQNLLVAALAVAPLLCGMVHCRTVDKNILLIASAICVLIFAREIIKDVEDLEGDKGWKNTIPVCFGPRTAVVVVEMVLGGAVILLCFSSLLPIRVTGLLLAGTLLFFIRLLVFRSRVIAFKGLINCTLAVVLSAALGSVLLIDRLP